MKKSNPASVVILGNGFQSLGIIRTSHNYNVYQLNDKSFSPSRYSRYLTEYIKLGGNSFSEILNNSEYLLDQIEKIKLGYPNLIFGTDEDKNLFIYKNRNSLSGKFFIPDNSITSIIDKYEFNKLLSAENRITTYLLSQCNTDDFLDCNYLIKGRKGNKFRNIIGKKAFIFSKKNFKKYKNLLNIIDSDDIIVQEIINTNNSVYSSCAFSIDGNLKSLFQYEKIRQHPRILGTGTFLKSLFNSAILEISGSILADLKYTGISEIEFIEDNGKFKCIEFNPRPWKSFYFAYQCGQNFIYDYFRYISGEKIKINYRYDINKYWIDIFTDYPNIFKILRDKDFKFKNTFECTYVRGDEKPFFLSILFAPFILSKI